MLRKAREGIFHEQSTSGLISSCGLIGLSASQAHQIKDSNGEKNPWGNTGKTRQAGQSEQILRPQGSRDRI
jgi:hypothetical protein